MKNTKFKSYQGFMQNRLCNYCVAALIALSTSFSAWACSPAPMEYYDIFHPYVEADVVFIGKLQSVVGVPDPNYQEGDYELYRMMGYTAGFEVVEAYKGVEIGVTTMQIESEHGDGNLCGVDSPFRQAEAGDIWVVMAYREVALPLADLNEPSRVRLVLLNPHYEPFAFDYQAQYQAFTTVAAAETYIKQKQAEVTNDQELRQQRNAFTSEVSD